MLARSAFKTCAQCGAAYSRRPTQSSKSFEKMMRCSHNCVTAWRHDQTAERFWARVNRCGADDCWEWQGHCSPKGYGETSYKGKRGMRAHRLAMILEGRLDDRSKIVLHSCDNPPCCNPKHLSVGTHADNNADMMAKGRYRHPRKLSDAQVTAIRAEVGTLKQIAAKYGVSFTHVGNIRKGVARV